MPHRVRVRLYDYLIVPRFQSPNSGILVVPAGITGASPLGFSLERAREREISSWI